MKSDHDIYKVTGLRVVRNKGTTSLMYPLTGLRE